MLGLSILLNVACMLHSVCAVTSTTTLTSTARQISTVMSTSIRLSVTTHGNIIFAPQKVSVSATPSKQSSTSSSPLGESVSVSSNNGTTSTSYTSDGEFQSSILAAHNFFRKEHNATALQWNSTSAKYAASYSEKCVFKHSGNPTGENLAEGYVNVTTAVNAWGLEREKYKYGLPGFNETTGHFTQLVWKATKTVGCGRYACDGNGGTSGYFVVCEYYPSGNVGGQYATQVGSQVEGEIEQGYGEGSKGSSGYGWLVAILVGLFVNIVFVVMLVWKLS